MRHAFHTESRMRASRTLRLYLATESQVGMNQEMV